MEMLSLPTAVSTILIIAIFVAAVVSVSKDTCCDEIDFDCNQGRNCPMKGKK